MIRISSKITYVTFSAMIAFFIGTNISHAERGKRLCGWYSGGTSLMVKVDLGSNPSQRNLRDNICSGVISGIDSAIKANETLKTLTWTKADRTSCESVGTAMNMTSVDFCGPMGTTKVTIYGTTTLVYQVNVSGGAAQIVKIDTP